MTDTSARRRTYRSTLREEQAEQTKLRIAHAARQRFVVSGWTGTSVRSVAAAAGVSEATVYATYGTKAALAISLVDSTDDDADVSKVVAEVAAADGDPAGQLAAFIRFDRRLFESGGDALRVIVEGRRHEPALDAAYIEGRRRGDQARRDAFAAWPNSNLRPDITTDLAVDIYAMTVSIQAYDIAISERNWTPDHIERWWTTTLTESLLT